MFNRIMVVDNFITDHVQKVANFILNHAGINCFWLARILYVLATCFSRMLIVTYALNTQQMLKAWPFQALSLLTRIILYVYIEFKLRQNTKEGHANGMRNDNNLLMLKFLELLGIIIFIPTSIRSLLVALADLVYVLSLYLFCCDIVPPFRKKIRSLVHA